MERGLILLVAAFMVYLARGVQGTSHLSFSNNTELNITRHGCGTSKLCVETPDDCDPTMNSSCLFTSVVTGTTMAPNGTDLYIGLRGDSMGYIALGLTVNASEGTTMLFICGSENGTFLFRTMQRNNSNGQLNATERRVKEIRSMVTGNVIQCEFKVPMVNATRTRASDSTTFSILLGTGNVTGGSIGSFSSSFDSGPLDITNAASNIAPTPTPAPSNVTTVPSNVTTVPSNVTTVPSNVTTVPSNVTTVPSNVTTVPSTTTGSSGAVHPHALLVLLGVLTLSIMPRA